MPTLDFKGKQFVYAHHLTVPFRQLDIDVAKSLPAKGAKPNLDDNLIIHGDNLHALKALLPKYAGKVNCIYIDPPYNTGNEGWCYSDNVNAPLIKEWLKDSANPVDGDDLERHDKWLCMMWPRLQLLKELLADDGVIFVSIGDDEASNLAIVLNEVFGDIFQVAKFTWKSRAKPTNAGNAKFRPQKVAEYIYCYSKKQPDEMLFNLYSGDERKYPHKDAEGNYRITTILTSNRGGFKRETMRTTLPNGFKPSDDQRWKVGEEEILSLYGRGRIIFNEENPMLKVYQEDEEELLYPLYTFMDDDLSSTAEAGKSELNRILGLQHGFDTVKPVNLIKYLIFISTNKNSIILDSFAGTATTAQAVLETNFEDGGNRKYLLVECENYANKITAERIRRVIKGVPSAKDDALKKGLGGSFTYCELGDEINIENLLKGNKLPSYEELARYAFYTATGQTLDKVKQGADFFIGETDQYRVHLIYQPDAKFLRSGESALNMPMAERIEKSRKDSKKKALVFATQKFMGQKELTDMGIVFCQLPYAIHRVMGD